MATKQTSGRITIANIIAIVGLALLLLFSFLGRSYKSGGELGWDIVISVAITAFTAFLLWFLIKAKGAENHLDNWKKAEFTALAFYIILAIPTSIFGGIMHFFVVNNQKEQFQKYAKADLKQITDLVTKYENFENQALTKTQTGLSNATGPNQIWDDALTRFMEQNNISHDRNSAKTFIDLQRTKLVGAGFSTYKNKIETECNEIESVINSWSVMQISSKAKKIDELAKSVGDELSKLSVNAKLPVVVLASSGRYIIKNNNQYEDFHMDNTFKFKKHLTETTEFSTTALLVVTLIHFMILFNYIVAYRTSTISIGKEFEEDGGKVL